MARNSFSDPDAALAWLVSEWTQHFRLAMESMSGAAVGIVQSKSDAVSRTVADLCWHQPYSAGDQCAVYVLAPESAWKTAGDAVLSAAGVLDADAADLESTYREVLQQSLSGLASSLTANAGREITTTGGGPFAEIPGAAGFAIRCKVGDKEFPVTLFVTAALGRFVMGEQAAPAAPVANTSLPAPAAPPQQAGASPSSSAASEGANAPPSHGTMALLYDVELPVSVSFGRAHLPLREVLKLTSGSIVELNRTIAEPVEIIVNNCVVARGEVVVVEGNYGVRILQIISQNERLRTLH